MHDDAPEIGGHVACRRCLIGRRGVGFGGRDRSGEGASGAAAASAPVGHHDSGAERRGFARRPAPGPGPPWAGAGQPPIATNRRRRPTLVPGDASSRVPSDDRGVVRPSGRTPIYSGRAASASNRPSIYNRAAVVAAGGGRAGLPAARSPGGRHKAARRARGSGRTAGIPATRAGPRRRGTSRCRRRRRSIRWRAATSVDSWRVLFCIGGGCSTLACRYAGRVTRAVKAVTACHGTRLGGQPVEIDLPFLRTDRRTSPAARASLPVSWSNDTF